MPKYADDVRFTQTWYANPPYPTTIQEVEANWPMFRQRAALIAARYPTITRVGVAGAGFGALVYYLILLHGKDAWGCDIAWAVNQASGTLGTNTSRIVAADVLIAADMEKWRLSATGSKSVRNKIPLIITEDLLPCVDSEAEVQTMLTNLRAVGTQLVHIITDGVGTITTDDMLWRTPQQWRTLIGPNEPIYLANLTEVP